MDPSVYLPAYLERTYVLAHPDLTDAARELLHEEVRRRPEAYASDGHAQALVAYARTHAHLHEELERMELLSDEEFEQRRAQLFEETRRALVQIEAADRLCADARLLNILLAETPLDACLNDLMQLEEELRDYLTGGADGFDVDAPGYWRADDPSWHATADPVFIGWVHTLEALAHGCLSSARYRAAASYARQAMRATGFPTRASGTLLLALARLEDEDAFFEAARGANGEMDDSPWFLLGRTILLYKLGRRKSATRALRDFAARCDGGAFFLINPTYMTPYLPARPEAREPWELSHQAVWEADGIIADTPDFALWAASVEGVDDISEQFADRNGF